MANSPSIHSVEYLYDFNEAAWSSSPKQLEKELALLMGLDVSLKEAAQLLEEADGVVYRQVARMQTFKAFQQRKSHSPSRRWGLLSLGMTKNKEEVRPPMEGWEVQIWRKQFEKTTREWNQIAGKAQTAFGPSVQVTVLTDERWQDRPFGLLFSLAKGRGLTIPQ